jgi:hypothetical protein
MSRAELDLLEGDVQGARRRLKGDLELLRAPETFADFKEQVVAETRKSRDDIIDNVKGTATDRAERFWAELKDRAAANPVAVGAIAAGIGWRILRKPPITTLLVGYGLYSLMQTRPGEPAPGAEAVYGAADKALEVKRQLEQWGSETGDAITRAADVAVPAVTDAAQRWSADIGEVVSQAANSAQAAVIATSQQVQHLASDAEERDKILLGAAIIALTAALGLSYLRRS